MEVRHLGRSALERLLTELEDAGDTAVAWTLYLPPGVSPEVAGEGPWAPPWPDVLQEAAPRLAASETGVVVLWGPRAGYAVAPPLPLRHAGGHPGPHAAPLRALLRREYRLGVVLLRLGGYAVGVFHGDRLVLSKTGTRYVKGRHRAGGSSARRFERIREKQVRELLDEACQVVRTRLEPVEGELDYVLTGGERHTLQAFLKRCPYLERLGPRLLRRVLDVPEPRQEVLEQAPALIWTSRVYVLRPLSATADGGPSGDRQE